MTDEQATNEEAVEETSEEVTEETLESVKQELMVIRQIHFVERQMLSRAIKALVGASSKPVEEIVGILSEGLDEGYTNAMKEAYGTSKVVKPQIKVPKLHLPY